MDLVFKIAADNPGFADARDLFQEYVNSLGLDLSFQNFSQELETLETQYNRPRGALWVAYANGIPAGCVAIREYDAEIAELKRMYVRPDYRGHKIGRQLLDLALDMAKTLGYKKVRLDSLPDMSRAQDLYRAAGFYEIPPYRLNPVEGSSFMEKILP